MTKCSNCFCEIEESKIILHERFCKENIKYCEKCKEPVLKEEYEEHCLEHDKPQEKVENNEEDKNNISLKRVQSSKIGCMYCGFMLGYYDLEEHEAMCGARTTPCKICHKYITYMTLDEHILTAHGLNKSIYNEFQSGEIQNYESKKSLGKIPNNVSDQWSQNSLDINATDSEKQIAYALALSYETNKSKMTKKPDNDKDKDKNKDKKNEKNNTEIIENNPQKGKDEIKNKDKDILLPLKKISSLNLDEIDDEYERQMYEEEMKNYE